MSGAQALCPETCAGKMPARAMYLSANSLACLIALGIPGTMQLFMTLLYCEGTHVCKHVYICIYT